MTDLDVIEPAPDGAVLLGEGPDAVSVTVRKLRVGQLPAFARALQPIADDVVRIMAGDVGASDLIALVGERTSNVVEVVSAATGVSAEAINEATIEQLLELVLAILTANRDFLRGRLMAAIKTAANLSRGDGPTPSSP